MNNEEKIIAMLEKHGEMLEQMQSDISGLKAGQNQTNERLDKLESTQEKMQKQLTKVAATQELEVALKIQVINEGIDMLHEKLDRLDIESRLDSVEEAGDAAAVAITALARDVARLKRAK